MRNFFFLFSKLLFFLLSKELNLKCKTFSIISRRAYNIYNFLEVNVRLKGISKELF